MKARQTSERQVSEEHEADAVIAAYARKARAKNIAAILIAILSILLVGWVLLGERIARTYRKASIEIGAKERLANMTTLERVHAELLPAWVISSSNKREDTSEKFELLLEALAEDNNARSIIEDLGKLTADGDTLTERGEEILDTVKLWNRYMDRAGQPWWVDGNIFIGPGNTFFYIKAYKILGDFEVTVSGGQKTYRTRMATRVDRTNIVESFLGHASPHQDGAIILTDRLYDVSLREVWPTLSPKIFEGSSPREKLFAQRVREEAKQHLSEETLALLSRHASTRAELEATLRTIRERRSCGSKFSITDLPWDGMPQDQIDLLYRYAERDRFADCPSIKEDEIEILVAASEALRDEDDLKMAAEELVAHVARAVTIHEARHVADHHRANAFDTPMPCEKCDAYRLSRSARTELSAYLASFASKEVGYTALYQACGLDLTRGTPHARALRVALPLLEVECETSLPDDLQARAKKLEVEFFGRSDTITLPEAYPTSLELYR
jgi:hypothetical protein